MELPARTNGDSIDTIPRPERVPPVRMVLWIWLRMGREVEHALHDDSAGEGDRAVRDPSPRVRPPSRNGRQGSGHRRHVFRPSEARSLPEGAPGDREAKAYKKGDYAGMLEEVKANIRRCGHMESCEFIKGWFKDTLPHLNSPVLLVYLDVDLEDSLFRYIHP